MSCTPYRYRNLFMSTVNLNAQGIEPYEDDHFCASEMHGSTCEWRLLVIAHTQSRNPSIRACTMQAAMSPTPM
jgi:hypothetical protein